MSSFSVVVHFDELEYFRSGIFQAQEASSFQQLGLEAGEERLVEPIYLVCDPKALS